MGALVSQTVMSYSKLLKCYPRKALKFFLFCSTACTVLFGFIAPSFCDRYAKYFTDEFFRHLKSTTEPSEMSLMRSLLVPQLKRSWSSAVSNGSHFTSSMMSKRFFAVRELPWCAPKSSPNRGVEVTSDTEKTPSGVPYDEKKDNDVPEPIDQFGIVAAMSQNRVIGLNGKIPWPRCAEDRENFKKLTHDGIMIIGRHTYEEEPNQRHIDHTKYCIVVSKTLTEDDIMTARPIDTKIRVAKSFPHALGLAKLLAEENYAETHDIICWVAGGERIYEEALRHKSAKELHLTTMHFEVDMKVAREETIRENKSLRPAVFPAKHHWDRYFQKVSESEGGGGEDKGTDAPRFTYVTYTRTTPRNVGCAVC